MFSNINNLFQTSSYNINSPEKNALSSTIRLINEAHTVQGFLTSSSQQPKRRSIQTNAEKGACRISRKLKEKIMMSSHCLPSSLTPSLIGEINYLNNDKLDSKRRASTKSDFKTEPYSTKANDSKQISVFSNKTPMIFERSKLNDDASTNFTGSIGPNSRNLSAIPLKASPQTSNFSTVKEDPFMKRILEYKQICARFSSTEGSIIQEEASNKYSSQKEIENIVDSHPSTPREAATPIEKGSNQDNSRRAKLHGPSKPAHRESIPSINTSEKESRISSQNSYSNNYQKNPRAEKKYRPIQNRQDSTFSYDYKDTKTRSTSITTDSVPKQVQLKRKLKLNSSDVENRGYLEEVSDKKKSRPGTDQDVLSLINSLVPPKKPDTRELREKYTRVNAKPKPKPKPQKKEKTFDIITLAEIHQKPAKSQIDDQLYRFAKGNMLDLEDYPREGRNMPPVYKTPGKAFKTPEKYNSKNNNTVDVIHESDINPNQKIANLIWKVMNVDDSSEIGNHFDSLVMELKKVHSFFQKLSYRGLKEILKGCQITSIKNKNLYAENDYGEYAYIILYGQVYLKTKSLGVFADCSIGSTLAEEAVLDNNFTRKETAQVLGEACLLELNASFMETLQSSTLEEDYWVLVNTLKRNMAQKKTMRKANIL